MRRVALLLGIVLAVTAVPGDRSPGRGIGVGTLDPREAAAAEPRSSASTDRRAGDGREPAGPTTTTTTKAPASTTSLLPGALELQQPAAGGAGAAGGSAPAPGLDEPAPPPLPPPAPPAPLGPSEGVCTGRGPDGGVPAGTFPGAACTGVPSGTALQPCGTHLTTPNATYERCEFAGGVVVGAPGITIRDSRVLGTVVADGCGAGVDVRGLQMIDVEIDGGSGSAHDDATGCLSGYTCLRCQVHDVGKGFTNGGFTVVDSYVFDLFGAGDSHNEAVLGSTGGIVIQHSNLVADFNGATTGGGMSAVIALYTHGGWGPLDDVLVLGNRLESPHGYCMYGGNSSDDDPTDVRVVDNVFVRDAASGTCGFHGPLAGWQQGNGNLWSGNRFDDGTPIPEPSTHDYT